MPLLRNKPLFRDVLGFLEAQEQFSGKMEHFCACYEPPKSRIWHVKLMSCKKFVFVAATCCAACCHHGKLIGPNSTRKDGV